MKQIREGVHQRLLKLRSLERLTESRRFEEIWETATERQRVEFEMILRSIIIDLEPFQRWMQNRRIVLLGEHTYAELRTLARNAQIVRYSRMSKGELLSALSREKS